MPRFYFYGALNQIMCQMLVMLVLVGLVGPVCECPCQCCPPETLRTGLAKGIVFCYYRHKGVW